jgi:hypothetical protein
VSLAPLASGFRAGGDSLSADNAKDPAVTERSAFGSRVTIESLQSAGARSTAGTGLAPGGDADAADRGNTTLAKTALPDRLRHPMRLVPAARTTWGTLASTALWTDQLPTSIRTLTPSRAVASGRCCVSSTASSRSSCAVQEAPHALTVLLGWQSEERARALLRASVESLGRIEGRGLEFLQAP